MEATGVQPNVNAVNQGAGEAVVPGPGDCSPRALLSILEPMRAALPGARKESPRKIGVFDDDVRHTPAQLSLKEAAVSRRQ